MDEVLKSAKIEGNYSKTAIEIPIQSAVGAKVISRETIAALRKDVTGYLYGGDRTRKDKLLKKNRRKVRKG